MNFFILQNKLLLKLTLDRLVAYQDLEATFI
jgi:hypothetical protein